MPNQQLARGLWAQFATQENPFGVANGMEENLRHIDDHLALYTLLPPQAPGTPLPGDPFDGDGQAYTDGSYATFNGGTWRTYAPRRGIRVVLVGGTDSWLNTGTGWEQFSVVDTGPAVQAAVAAATGVAQSEITPLMQEAQAARDEAVPAASAAQAARTGAEAARDAAMLSAGVYATTAAGLAATTSGRYFSVPASASSEYLILYQNNAGTALEIKRYASSSAVERIDQALRTNFSGFAFALQDRIGQLGLSVTEDLLWTIYGSLDATLTDAARNRILVSGAPEAVFAGLSIKQSFASGFLDLCDAAGNVFFRVDAETGKVSIDPSQDVADRIAALLAIGQEAPPQRLADIVHVWVHGQSLSLGTAAGGTISGLTTENVLMPNYGILDGVEWGDGLTGTTSASTSFSPLNAQTNSRTLEPPGASIGNQFAKLAAMTNPVLISHSGHGSYNVAKLDKTGEGDGPTQPYQLAINQALNYKNIANAGGNIISTSAMVWIQGETDISISTAPSVYKERVLKLREDYAADVGQRLPLLVLSQVASHTKRTPGHAPDIGIAQWEMSAASDVLMACPMYQFNYATDGIHLPAHSSRWLGCYIGRALYHTITLGEKWRPLEPTDVWRQGKLINVYFHVPVGPLVLDTVNVTDPGNYGFEVFDANGSALGIASVSVAGNRAQITLATTPTGPVTVGYALGTALTGANAGRTTGARGCLRDSDSATGWANDASGQPYKLFNWSVMFKIQEIA